MAAAVSAGSCTASLLSRTRAAGALSIARILPSLITSGFGGSFYNDPRRETTVARPVASGGASELAMKCLRVTTRAKDEVFHNDLKAPAS